MHTMEVFELSFAVYKGVKCEIWGEKTFFFLKLSKTAGIVQILIYFRLYVRVIAKGRTFSTPPELPKNREALQCANRKNSHISFGG